MRKIFRTLALAALMLLVLAGGASAADINVSTSSASAETGQSFNMTLSVSSSETIGAFKFYVRYDSSIVEYVPSDADSSFCNGGGGLLIFVGDPMNKSQSYTIKFKAVKDGSTKFSVSYDNGDVMDANYNAMNVKKSEGSVTVKAPREASGDCDLAGLKLGEGSFSPAFSKDTLEYSISVGADVNALTINAAASSKYASVSVKGNELSAGDNRVSIVVTAENGSQKTYVIKVSKAEATPTLSPTETPTPTDTPTPTEGIRTSARVFIFDENGQLINEDRELELCDVISAQIPEGFEAGNANVLGADIEVLRQIDGSIVLVQLSDGRLYIYDEEEGSFKPFNNIKTIARNYRIGIADPADIPAGYELFAFEEDGSAYPAYRMNEEDDIILFYVDEGSWYRFDPLEGTFQRYIPSDESVVVITVIATPSEAPELTPAEEIASAAAAAPDDPTPPEDKKDSHELIRNIITGILAFLALLFFILFIRAKKSSDAADEIKETRNIDYSDDLYDIDDVDDIDDGNDIEDVDDGKKNNNAENSDIVEIADNADKEDDLNLIKEAAEIDAAEQLDFSVTLDDIEDILDGLTDYDE